MGDGRRASVGLEGGEGVRGGGEEPGWAGRRRLVGQRSWRRGINVGGFGAMVRWVFRWGGGGGGGFGRGGWDGEVGAGVGVGVGGGERRWGGGRRAAHDGSNHIIS